MKKKHVANLVMVAIIVVIAAAGLIFVGHTQGVFDKSNGSEALLCDVTGVITLERNGVSYPVEKKTVLRAGDKLKCNTGATGTIEVGDSSFIIGEKAELSVSDAKAENFKASVKSGEVFLNCNNTITLVFADKEMKFTETTALLSVREGAQSISVLRGTVAKTESGKVIDFTGDKKNVDTLHIESLNDFTIAQIRAMDDNEKLCFTISDLDKLEADRQAAIQELINSQEGTVIGEEEATSKDSQAGTSTGNSNEKETTTKASREETTTKKGSSKDKTTKPSTGKDTTTKKTSNTETTTEAPVRNKTCTIAIYCDTILDNMDNLEPGKSQFVPSNGVILAPVTVKFADGETVFDVLKRVCNTTGIQIEYSWTPMYDSYYVEGINNLYEFDCGYESGWMYKVNGWFPNYGSSSYTLKDGDVIVWSYTCTGLGEDVGAPRQN